MKRSTHRLKKTEQKKNQNEGKNKEGIENLLRIQVKIATDRLKQQGHCRE